MAKPEGLLEPSVFVYKTISIETTTKEEKVAGCFGPMVELMANVEEAIGLCLEVQNKDDINVFNKDYINTK